ncbi:hypothetical protein AAC387_Pa05g1095 [Persea americana]
MPAPLRQDGSLRERRGRESSLPKIIQYKLLHIYIRQISVNDIISFAANIKLQVQYVLPGSEGRATDARILHNVLSRIDPLVVPPGRYYLVDAGFANAPGFLAPYRGVRYHLKDHSRQTLDNAKELFNKRHSQAWDFIEMAFGL